MAHMAEINITVDNYPNPSKKFQILMYMKDGSSVLLADEPNTIAECIGVCVEKLFNDPEISSLEVLRVDTVREVRWAK